MVCVLVLQAATLVHTLCKLYALEPPVVAIVGTRGPPIPSGGGVCYDAVSCRASGLLGGVGANPIQDVIEAPVRNGVGIFDRNDPTNPFRDFSFVVLPHCTGDFHLGDNVRDYATIGTIHHRGYPNVTRALERIVPTFGDAERVVASGFSAGGVGITGNYHQIATAFESTGGPTPVLIDDSGPKLRPAFFDPGGQNALRASWALDETLGRFCPTCLSAGLHEIYATNQRLHPALRSSLICAREDAVVTMLYAYFNRDFGFDGPRLSAGLGDLAGWFDALRPELAPAEQARIAIGQAAEHRTPLYPRIQPVDQLVEARREQPGKQARPPFEALRCGQQVASAWLTRYPHAGGGMPRVAEADKPKPWLFSRLSSHDRLPAHARSLRPSPPVHHR